jgi:hypothetical protein
MRIGRYTQISADPTDTEFGHLNGLLTTIPGGRRGKVEFTLHVGESPRLPDMPLHDQQQKVLARRLQKEQKAAIQIKNREATNDRKAKQ